MMLSATKSVKKSMIANTCVERSALKNVMSYVKNQLKRYFLLASILILFRAIKTQSMLHVLNHVKKLKNVDINARDNVASSVYCMCVQNQKT